MLETAISFVALKAMYAAAVLGAGAVGLTILLAPVAAERYIFAGSTSVSPYIRILGALWFALGTVAALGFADPLKFAPVLLVQFVYKSVWLLAVAYPVLWAGNRETGLVFMTALFTIWAVALAVTVPYGYLLGR